MCVYIYIYTYVHNYLSISLSLYLSLSLYIYIYIYIFVLAHKGMLDARARIPCVHCAAETDAYDLANIKVQFKGGVFFLRFPQNHKQT